MSGFILIEKQKACFSEFPPSICANCPLRSARVAPQRQNVNPLNRPELGELHRFEAEAGIMGYVTQMNCFGKLFMCR